MNFSVLGIPVRVSSAFWVIGFLLGMDRADQPALLLAWMVAVFLSVLLHELGHALTARAFGHRAEIELHGMGGTATWGGGPEITPGQRLTVSLAGPGLEIAVGLTVVLAWWLSGGPTHPTLQVAATDFAYISIVWGALNLVPIPPLDGSHAVEAVSRWFEDPVRRGIVWTGTAVGVVVILIGAYFGFVGGLFLLGWIGISWVLQARAERAHTQMVEPLATMLAKLEAGRRGEALVEAERLLKVGGLAPQAQTWVAVTGAQLALAGGSPERASALLHGLPEGAAPPLSLEVDLLIALGRAEAAVTAAQEAMATGDVPSDEASQALCVAAHASEDWALGVEAAAAWFQRSGDALAAYNAACFSARSGDLAAALGWLEQAVGAGWKEPLAGDPDLVALREDPRFAALERKIGEAGR